MTNKPVLIVMTKWPAPGRCKSRLSKDIGTRCAARIQKKLINHTLTIAKDLAEEGLVELQLSISGLGPRCAKRWGQSQGLSEITLQGKGSLGVRMRKQVILAQKNHSGDKTKGRPTILIGTDLPSLCPSDLLKAIETLQSSDLVIGPAIDGGYWLLGLSENLAKTIPPWPFSGISWGTNQVLEQTLSKARDKRKLTFLLEHQNDLDSLQDLLPWRA